MIPFFDLTRQYRNVKNEIDEAVGKVMSRGIFSLGSEVETFEKEFAEYLGVPHAVGVGSGTDALTMSVKALGLGTGDEVIVPANCYPTVFGIALLGVKIKLCDCDESGLIDPDRLISAITSKTKAVVAVHLYGNPCDIFRIQEILDRYSPKQKIYLIEDCAQAHGAGYINQNANIKNQNVMQKSKSKNLKKNEISTNYQLPTTNYNHAGSIGDIGIFSFYPTKNLGAYGDGGMITVKNQKSNIKNQNEGQILFERVKQLRQYGERERYKSEMVSGVSRLDEIQAAILRVKLKYLDGWNVRRREISEYYEREIEGAGDIKVVSSQYLVDSTKNNTDLNNSIPTTIYQLPTTKSCHHLFVIRTKFRDKLKEYLTNQGIGTAIHYPVPIHLVKAFTHLGYKKGDFPVSEKLSREVLSLPLFPELKDAEAEEVVKNIKSYFHK